MKRRRYLAQLKTFRIISFTRKHAERAAVLASFMKGETIGLADLQIAATALVDGAELLTLNRGHFSRVPGLKLAAVCLSERDRCFLDACYQVDGFRVITSDQYHSSS
jgi:predicted nucleic acid-binding protein